MTYLFSMTQFFSVSSYLVAIWYLLYNIKHIYLCKNKGLITTSLRPVMNLNVVVMITLSFNMRHFSFYSIGLKIWLVVSRLIWIMLFNVFCLTNYIHESSTRSSPSEVFLRKGVLKICDKFTGEHPLRSVISMKFFKNTSRWLPLKY